MKKQPAKTNYFFKGGYVELKNVIVESFSRCKDDISDSAEKLADHWYDFTDSFADFIGAFGAILQFDFSECGSFFPVFWHLFLVIFSFFKLIFVAIFTTILVSLFSALHVCLLIPFFLPVYLMFMFVRFCDAAFRAIKKISNVCPVCQQKYPLAVYECPKCHANHDVLIPSKYGIFKRVCECGHKIPTTFFNGRGKLNSHCPHCGTEHLKGNEHANVLIPLIGGPSSGKTCFVTMAMKGLEEGVAQANGLEYKYAQNGLDDYEQDVKAINNCRVPQKTRDTRLKYYQFYLTPKKEKIKNLISLCDVGGEVYESSDELGQQIGYKFADAFLVLIDPLSITDYKKELTDNKTNISKYNGSVKPIDEIMGLLFNTLSSMFKMNDKKARQAMLNTNLCLVFTKGDIPGLSEKIGTDAVNRYMEENPGKNKLEAYNELCLNFLLDYNEANFVNEIKSKFKDFQFFTVSALGHAADGTRFAPVDVEDPVLWIIDKSAKNINLKNKWGKTI